MTYEPTPTEKQVECLSFGPIELAPHLRLEIENNLVSNSCMYSTLLRTNPQANKMNFKGIKVNTKASLIKEESSLKESKKGRKIEKLKQFRSIKPKITNK